MLIICPKCFAQYDVSGLSDTQKNQEYHCSNCNHYFVAEPQEYLSESDSAAPVSTIMVAPTEKPLKMPRCLEDAPRTEPVALQPDLGYIPEEFKPVPVPKKKKSSVLVVFVYLMILAALGYAGYVHRDLIWNQFKGVWVGNGLPTLEAPAPVVVPDNAPLPPEPAPEKPEAQPIAVEMVVEPVNPVALAVAERLSVAVAEPKAVAVQTVAPQTPTVDMTALKEILKIQDVSFTLGLNAEGVNQLLIEGNLVNTDLAPIDTPDLTAVVYDRQDMVVARKRIVPSQKTLAGNTKEPFYTGIIPAPESVGRVEVNFEE